MIRYDINSTRFKTANTLYTHNLSDKTRISWCLYSQSKRDRIPTWRIFREKNYYFKLLYNLNQVCELETRLSEMNKMKDEEESSRKNAEEMIEKLKQESKDKVYIF